MFNSSPQTQSHAQFDRALTIAVVGAALVLALSFAVAQPGQAPAQPAPVPFAPGSTPDQEKLRIVPAKRFPGKVHVLPATIDTTQWGWFNNAQPPVLNVASGDTIVFEMMMHSHNQVVPGVTIEQIKKLRTDFP